MAWPWFSTFFENALVSRVNRRIPKRRELARAMRNDYIEDPQGREVRKYHPVLHYEGEHKISIWAEITTAQPEHMQVSLQQRRQAILERCFTAQARLRFLG